VSAVVRLERIVLICTEPRRLARFYETALGFTRTGTRTIGDPELGRLLRLPRANAEVVALQLGEQLLELMRIEPGGRPYPGDVAGTSGLFQHFAIEVPDMDQAMTRLRANSDWTAISTDGPQTLPAASGGVTAFKFRDPEGHPLELIADAVPAHVLRIDHSAISVASDQRSSAFYECLGLKPTGASLNVGPEQERLDGIPGARVAVTALTPRIPVPHLELLCYGNQFVPAAPEPLPHDIASTWLVFTVQGREDLTRLLHQVSRRAEPVLFADGCLRALVRDPDGHWLCLEVGNGPAQPPVAKPG
jgi:catechol 2,3-dioxygenase-like lactoylglutathione lyase family enzyme